MNVGGSPFVISQDHSEIYKDLYDSLFLQCLLQHSSALETQSVRTTNFEKLDATRYKWHRLLDGLCFLSDWKNAGKSVVSMAAQQDEAGTVLWIASSSIPADPENGTVNHLKSVIDLLSQSVCVNTEAKASAVKRIVQLSIERSPRRVRHYGSRLNNLVADAKSALNGSSDGQNTSGARLLHDLESLGLRIEHHVEFCNLAYDFRNLHSFNLLATMTTTTGDDLWIRIRHFIGRLGYWHKTAIRLVKIFPVFASIFRRYRIESIPSLELGKPYQPRLDGDLQNLVCRVFPNFRDTEMCAVLLSKLRESGELETKLRAITLKPRPHSELVVLNHFYSQRFGFVGDDRYIGCSKPSCYCCSLYMKFHPGNYEHRPTHGNVWIQWCLPNPLNAGAGRSRITDVGILRRMANETQRQTRAVLTNNSVLCRNRFDSTTGLSISDADWLSSNLNDGL